MSISARGMLHHFWYCIRQSCQRLKGLFRGWRQFFVVFQLREEKNQCNWEYEWHAQFSPSYLNWDPRGTFHFDGEINTFQISSQSFQSLHHGVGFFQTSCNYKICTSPIHIGLFLSGKGKEKNLWQLNLKLPPLRWYLEPGNIANQVIARFKNCIYCSYSREW